MGWRCAMHRALHPAMSIAPCDKHTPHVAYHDMNRNHKRSFFRISTKNGGILITT
jgi:hypothetical protein